MKKELALSSLLLVAASATAANQPNLVVLFVDDLGWADLGYQNAKFDTPNINQLQEKSLYFSRGYISTATSSPSRAALMTGKEALRCGFVRHIYGGDETERNEFQILEQDPAQMKSRAWLPLEEITYAERLKELGYYNYFVGKWHLGHEPYFPIHQGFDAMYGTTEHGHPASYYQPFFKTENPFPDAPADKYLTDQNTDGAVEFIKNYDKNQPFLLNFWYYDVHSPLVGRKDYVAHYMKKGMSKVDADYAAMVKSLDDSVGRIIKALEDKKIDDNTIVVLLSDQGGQFKNGHLRGGKKGGDTLAEGGSRVPMMIYAPGMKAMGTTYDKPVSSIDVFPTLIELASGKKCKDKQVEGVSWMPIMKGSDIKDRSIFLYRSYEDQNSAIIKNDWKLIKYRSGKTELYNLAKDESETNNLAAKDSARASKMLKELLAWEKDAIPAELVTEGRENSFFIKAKKAPVKKAPAKKPAAKKKKK